MKLTKDILRDKFDYSPDGCLIWKISPSRYVKKGQIAGTSYYDVRGRKHNKIVIDGQRYYTHRLIFAWHHGFFPEQVDHKNQNRDDNRIENLRAANASQNIGNQSLRKTNKSGLKGVYWDKSHKKWRAAIGSGPTRKSLGRFDKKEDAAEAYKIAAVKHFGEFANFG